MSYSAEVLADSPLAYWKLDETSGTNAADSSGNGRDATDTPGITVNTTSLLADGTGKARTFTANTSTGIQIASAAWMNVSALTVECLVKFSSAVDGLNGDAIVSRYGGAGIQWLLWRNTSGKLALQIQTSGGLVNVAGTTTVVNGTTYHVAATWDGSTGRIYVNGTQENSAAVTGTLSASTEALRIGCYSNSASTVPGMVVDEVSFTGTAVNSTRISARYLAATTVTTPGTFAATLPTVTASFTGSYRDAGTFTAALPSPLTASFSGTYAAPPTGSFGATLPAPLTADLAGTYTAPPNPSGDFAAILPVVTASFTGDYHPHEAGTFDAILPFPTAAFAGTYTPGMESGTLDAVLPILAADFTGTYTPLSDHGSIDALLPLVAAALSGIYTGPVQTDTSNALDGLDLVFTGTVTLTRPAAAPPATLVTATKYDKAVPYPVPVMVNGRPT